MAYVYVLKSFKNSKRYVGFSKKDPYIRLQEHNHGNTSWTRKNKPFELVHIELYVQDRDARRREKFLKTGHGRRFLDKILGNDLSL
jgi:putative endonuclease